MNAKEVLALSLARRLGSSGVALSLRQQAGLSLRDVASAVGSVPSCVWRWERGERRPRGAAGVAYGELLASLQKVAA